MIKGDTTIIDYPIVNFEPCTITTNHQYSSTNSSWITATLPITTTETLPITTIDEISTTTLSIPLAIDETQDVKFDRTCIGRGSAQRCEQLCRHQLPERLNNSSINNVYYSIL
jgi:hypothetical protein